MFTGDASGRFLYPALYKAGFANQAEAESRSDGLRLNDMFITASARCAPPDNKPSPEELNNCQAYLVRELEIIKPKVIVCLGRIAFDRILKMYGLRISEYKFSHGATFDLQPSTLNFQPATLLCSYHPSQQNTSTGKLTVKMFDAIWKKAKELLK